MSVQSSLVSSLTISQSEGLTPLPNQTPKKREVVKFTASPVIQKAHRAVSVIDEVCEQLIAPNREINRTNRAVKLNAPKEIYKQLINPLERLDVYASAIEEHVELRVALFFKEAIACWDTPYHFRVGTTHLQFGSAPALKICSGKQQKSIRFQAAHSSTIPSLEACKRKDYLKHGDKTPFFRFLFGSHSDYVNNSTVALPLIVNQLDSLLDGKATDSKGLRYKSVQLLNQMAESKLDPIEGVRKFLRRFKARLDDLLPDSKSEEIEKVIGLYRTTVKNILSNAMVSLGCKEAHPFFDSILGFDASTCKKRWLPTIRKIIFGSRMELAREAEFTEAKIQHQIDSAFPRRQTYSSRHELRLFLAYYVYDNQVHGKGFKRNLLKMLHISVAPLKESESFTRKYQEFVRKNKKGLAHLVDEILRSISDFQLIQQGSLGEVLEHLREEISDYSHEEFSCKVDEVIKERLALAPKGNYRELLKQIKRRTFVMEALEVLLDFDSGSYGKAYEQECQSIFAEALGVPKKLFDCPFFND